MVYEGDILLGDVFTELLWTPWLAEPDNGVRVGEPIVRHAIALRVEGIEAYRHQFESLPSGMSGALKLTGTGQELLRAVDPAVPKKGEWILIGERPA